MKMRNKLPAAPATGTATLVVSWPMFIGLLLALLGPWVGLLVWQLRQPTPPDASIAATRPGSTASRSWRGTRESSTEESVEKVHSDRVAWCRPGPWGDIQVTRISIEMPSEFVFLDQSEPPQVRWFVREGTRATMLEAFQRAGFTPEQLEQVSDPALWQEDSTGAWVTPPDDVVLGLSQQSRTRLYNSLSLFAENDPQRTAFTYRPQYLEERLEDSGLKPETVAMFRQLLYPRGNSLLFADTVPMLRWLKDDDAERRRFVKTISRKTTMLAKLRIDESTNIDELVRYWGVGGRSKDLRPLLESIQRVQGGGFLDVIHLLPAIARRRLYTFPISTEDSMALQPDCHWTAMNFFNDPPDDRFVEIAYASNVVRSEYSVIAEPGQLGDLVFITDPSGGAIHSAVYIADDLVFTKNGARFTEPWTLMHLSDMLDIYLAAQPADSPLKVVYFRHHKL